MIANMRFLLGGLALSTPVLGSISPRQNNCQDRTYTTPIGLSFDITCNVNVATGDLRNNIQANLEDCIDACSTSGADPGQDPCVAVAWNTKENRCWQKGLNVFSQGPLSADDTIMAFADRTIFEDRSDACGYTNQTVTEDINKRQYQMLCGVRWKGDNYDPDIRDSYPAKHTETLEECLEYCDEGTPICYGVLYSPNLGIGYRNCWAKNVNSTTEPSTIFTPDANAVTALALRTVNSTCANNDVETANGAIFKASCDHGDSSPDIDRLYTASFDECIQACANYTPNAGDTVKCNAVLYQPSQLNGYLNCRRKYALSNVTEQGEWHIATLESSPTNGTSSDGDNVPGGSNNTDSGSSSDTGLIVGAVVGPVVGLALIGGLGFWFWRRRRNSKSGGSSSGDEMLPFNSDKNGAKSPYLDQQHASMMSKPHQSWSGEVGTPPPPFSPGRGGSGMLQEMEATENNRGAELPSDERGGGGGTGGRRFELQG